MRELRLLKQDAPILHEAFCIRMVKVCMAGALGAHLVAAASVQDIFEEIFHQTRCHVVHICHGNTIQFVSKLKTALKTLSGLQ